MKDKYSIVSMSLFSFTSIKLLVKFCITIAFLSHNSITNAAKPSNKFSAILVFGDSLVDTGNNYINTLARANHAPYGMSFPNHTPTGRFSDGKLMSDLLAESLGIKELVPPFLDPKLKNYELGTGVCFASAGSGYDNITTLAFSAITVSKQLDYFKQYVEKLKKVVGQENANQTLRNALVFAVAGSNDYLLNFYELPNRRNEFSTSGFEDFLHQKIQDFAKTVYDAGCRNMLIAGLPPLADGLSYNKKLKELVLPKVQKSLPGSQIVYADIYTPIMDMLTNPLRYGFAMMEAPCCSGVPVCMPGNAICPNPKQFFKFDSVHLTEAAYRVMTRYLVDNAIPQFSRMTIKRRTRPSH